RFSADDYALDKFDGPTVGEKAPDFTCTTIDNQSKRILDFDGDFLVLELGSITCPLFQQRRSRMSQLYTQLPNVSHAILYVREAHPGSKIPPHQSVEERRKCAQLLQKDDGEERLILIDGLDGAAHQAYGSLPNSVYIINANGCIVYRALWNNASATRQAITTLVAGKTPNPESFFTPATPAVLMRTLRRGGNEAVTDFLWGLPQLVWRHAIKKNVQILFNPPSKSDTSVADLDC
ncbi:MAG: deiodinase-like protein, partial [Chloroflexota bacterium]